MIDAILATVFTLGSDITLTIQFYREYFAMKGATDDQAV